MSGEVTEVACEHRPDKLEKSVLVVQKSLETRG
jgi:hypothetical protein